LLTNATTGTRFASSLIASALSATWPARSMTIWLGGHLALYNYGHE
jgi:hypothetical protein